MSAWEVTAHVTVLRDHPGGDVLVVGFSSPDDDDDTLVLMRALRFDEEDARLGMDTCCIVTGDGATEGQRSAGNSIQVAQRAHAAIRPSSPITA